MDAFTALGLASNIVQFVDFSWKLVAESRAIYKSSEGASHENLTLIAIANNVAALSNAIEVSTDDSQLEKLAKECKTIGKELSDALDELRANGKRTMWTSFSIALKEIWKKGKVDRIYNRLGKVQAQMAIYLQFLML
jgi:hypothetical protein